LRLIQPDIWDEPRRCRHELVPLFKKS
jgi:hypothetical protein